MSNDSADGGGIGGKKIALVAAVLVGVVLVVRALRGGDGDSDDAALGADADESPVTDAADSAASDALPVDADVESAMDEIDIVDAIYILVAGLKAAREEYRQRTDDGGA